MFSLDSHGAGHASFMENRFTTLVPAKTPRCIRWRGPGDYAHADQPSRHFPGAGQRARPTAGYADNAEPIELQTVCKSGDIIGPVRQCPDRASHPGFRILAGPVR